MIIVNFKNYLQPESARNLIQVCKKVSHETGVRIVPAVQIRDLAEGCWTQEFYKSDVPTLLNHSDYPLTFSILSAQCSMLKAERCICVKSVDEAVRVASLQPEWLAYEPPELIGNTQKSVSSERPQDIQKIVSSIQCPVLVGAGIHSVQDIKTALDLGAKGVLVATAVVKSFDPESKLRELAVGFR